MSDTEAFGFGKFIPGFDFLQNLAQGKSASGVPPLSSWVAPTVSVEEISKRIEELKAVQFWLEQNTRALAATVQALEVQKLTLSTLQGMNVSMADVARSFGGAAAPKAAAASAEPAAHADWPMSAKKSKSGAAAAHQPGARGDSGAQKMAESAPQAKDAEAAAAPAAGSTAAGMGEPMMWWSALSQQFQHIAAQAMQDPAQQQAMAKATHMASDFTKAAMQAASTMVQNAAQGGAGKAASGRAAAARSKPSAAAPAPAARAAAPRTTAAKAAAPRKAAAKRTTAKKAPARKAASAR